MSADVTVLPQAGTAVDAPSTALEARSLQAGSAEAVARSRDVEQRYRELFEHTSDGVFLIDVADDGRFRVAAFNPAEERLVGISSAAAAGKAIDELVSAEVAEDIRGKYQRCLESGQPLTYNEDLALPSGRRRFSTTVVPLKDERGVCRQLIGIARNVTEEVAAETAAYRIADAVGTVPTLKELLRSIHLIIAEQMPAENFYIALLRPGTQIIDFPYLVDQQDGDEKPRNVGRGLTGYVLRTGEALLLNGEEEYDEMVRKGEVERIGPPSLSWLGVPLKTQDRTVGCLVAQSYTEGVYYGEREKELLRFVSTQVARAIEAKQAEESLRESERRLRVLIENSSDITMIASPEGEVIFDSASVKRMLGHAPVRLLAEYLHPDDLPGFLEKWGEVLARPGVPVAIAGRVRHLDESWRALEGVCVNLVSDPAVRGVVVNLRDVTERKQIEAQLLAADRMVSLGTLAAGVAHEINNPLTYVIGNLTFAIEALALPGTHIPESVEALREAQQGAERVRQIVRDLKTFSRSDDTPPAPVDVHRVLEASINMAWNEMRQRCLLVKHYKSGLPPTLAHEARLGQVFLNLLINAAQAIPEGDAKHNEIRITTGFGDGKLFVEIKDTGSGISAEHLQRLFDPFFTTKPPGVGTGLGLFICQGIVRSLGGDLLVESEVGKGTSFRVVLPSTSLANAAAPSAIRAPIGARRTKILAIDDEPLVGKVLAIALAAHEVVTLTSAVEALARIRQGERFDLIFCDLMMPHMNGMEFFTALSAEVPELAERLVFLTGGAFTEGARQFLERTSALTVEKPFSVQSIRALVMDLSRSRGPSTPPGPGAKAG